MYVLYLKCYINANSRFTYLLRYGFVGVDIGGLDDGDSTAIPPDNRDQE